MNEAQAILELGAQRVRNLGVINRSDKGKHRASPRFNDRVKEFNQALQREMYRSDKPIHFWYHKGLSSRAIEFINDGVHLNPDGLKKYLLSLRRAVLKFTADMMRR